MYKIRLQRHVFETCNKGMKWQDIYVGIKTLSPGDCLPLTCPGAIYMYKIKKKLYKIRRHKRFFLNLQQMTKVTSCSCWHKNVVPKGLAAPALGLYTCMKSWKELYKIRLQKEFLKLVANDRSDKRFPLTSKFCPLELSVPDLQLYTFIKSWKDVYKVRGWRDSFFNLQQMTIVIRPSCWHKFFGLNGLSAPAQGLYLNFFSSITAYFNISSALRWAILDQWSSGLLWHFDLSNFFKCQNWRV